MAEKITVPIRDASGGEVGSYELDPEKLVREGRISKQLLHDVVVMYQANKRQGTHKSKSRGEIRGSTQKLFRQKGTGRARVGPKRSPIRRGGGHTFAKRPRDFSYRLPRKAVRIATRMALLSKFQDDQAVVLDQLSVETPQTKVIAELLKSLGLAKDSCLLTIEQHDPSIWKSARNIEKLWVAPASQLNAYDLLHQRNLLVTKAAIDALCNPAAGGES